MPHTSSKADTAKIDPAKVAKPAAAAAAVVAGSTSVKGKPGDVVQSTGTKVDSRLLLGINMPQWKREGRGALGVGLGVGENYYHSYFFFDYLDSIKLPCIICG